MTFPASFRFGAATSSYQIEGAWNEDGKGPSIWDQFSHTEGRIFHGNTGDIACDHYHRYAEDVALMQEIGLEAYRFSISWPRVLPQGQGSVNEPGLDFYDRLVDALLAAGVEPWATLYHWDLPWALQLAGGWANPAIVHQFAEYAALMGQRLGDRVLNWFTLNEPQCFTGLAYNYGHHAPGLKAGLAVAVPVIHHALRAHGQATRALRANCTVPVRIGFAPTGAGVIPASESPADIEAARAELFRFHDNEKLWTISWFTDPVVLGSYPVDGLLKLERYLPDGWQADLPEICQPLDFLGLNLYNGRTIRDNPEAPQANEVKRPDGYAQTAMKWPVSPGILYWTVRFAWERYSLPPVISENGLSSMDWVHLDGSVPDLGRIDYLKRYLAWLGRAVAEGVPVQAYFYWSLMDNFEWTEGFKERFGLIHVDYATQKRTLKASARWYAGLIKNRGAELAPPGLSLV